MAKQQGSGVVAAAARVSDIQGRFQDLGGQFMTGYNKTIEKKKAKEDANKEIQDRVNNLMGGFKNDIDVLKFKPEDQNLVKSTIVKWRDEYAAAANAAAKIQNKSSAEYQAQMDIINGIQNRMVNLKTNLDNLAAFKKEYGESVDAGVYSYAGSNNTALAQGETMLAGNIGGITDSGDLTWSPATVSNSSVGEEFSFQDYKKPFMKATEAANAWAKIAEPYTKRKSSANGVDDINIRTAVSELLKDKNTLESLISDTDMPELLTRDIDPEDPNARDIFTERLVQAVYDQWGAAVEYEPGKDNRTAAQKNATENRNRISNYFDKNAPYFEVGDYGFENRGDHWVILDKDGLPLLTSNGKERKARSKQDVYAILGL